MRSPVLLMLLMCSALWAQQVQVEVQVPLDSAGVLVEISPELQTRTQLFPEVEDFLSARLFQGGDSSFVLEIAYREEGRLARRRSLMTAAQVRTFRQELTHALQSPARTQRMDQEGRPGLIVRQTLMGLGLYGWTVPRMMEIDGTRGTIAAYMLTSAASFALPYYLTRNRPVTTTQTMMTTYGSTRGLLYGLFVRNMVAPDAYSDAAEWGPPLLGSLIGSVAAFRLAEKSGLTLGSAELIGVMGDFGSGFGLGTTHLAELWNGDDRERAAHSLMLGMTGAGLAGGYLLSQREHYTRGDAYVLRMEGILGAQIMMPIAAAIADKKEKSYTVGAMTGGVLGVGIGNWLLKDEDFDFNEGALISCGQIAGGLLAGGLTYLIDTNENFDGLVYHSAIALGSLAGHAFLYHTFKLRR